MVCNVPLSRALLVAGAERGGTRAHSSESESTMGKRGEREKRQLILENKIGREFGGVDGKRVGGPRGRRETEEEMLVVNRRGSRE